MLFGYRQGVDVGVGASCIFPLLATSLHPSWKFIGSDINPGALESARENVKKNGCEAKIELRQMAEDAKPLADLLKESDGAVDFTMCNPPFFANESEMGGAGQYRAFTGNLQEVVTEGGETRFIERMIEDSLELQKRVRWFTSMVGQKKSLKAVMAKAKQAGARVVTSQAFFQGQTLRWGVAWSFTAEEVQQRRQRLLSRLAPDALSADIAARIHAIPTASLAWNAPLSGPADVERDGEAVWWRGVGDGKVLAETWTRRARRQWPPLFTFRSVPVFCLPLRFLGSRAMLKAELGGGTLLLPRSPTLSTQPRWSTRWRW